MKKIDKDPKDFTTVAEQTIDEAIDKIRDEATLWLLAIAEDNSEANQQALQAWLSLSEKHQSVYAQLENMWQLADDLPLELFSEELEQLPTVTLAECTAPVNIANQQDSFLAQFISFFTMRNTMYVASFASAVLAILLTFSNTELQGISTSVAAGTEKNNSLRDNEYQSKLGVHQTITAKDGSVIVLSAKSHVFIDYSAKQRDIYLYSGEALFTVAKDKSRPFVVHNQGRSVQALGTIFNVKQSKTTMHVAVLEGIVEVSAQPVNNTHVSKNESQQPSFTSTAKLVAGQALYLDIKGQFSEAYTIETNEHMPWQGGRLNYVNTNLDNVIFDLKRYSNLSIHIPDKQVANMGYTGSVIYDKVDDWLIALPYIFPVEVQRHGETVVIVKRKGN